MTSTAVSEELAQLVGEDLKVQALDDLPATDNSQPVVPCYIVVYHWWHLVGPEYLSLLARASQS